MWKDKSSGHENVPNIVSRNELPLNGNRDRVITRAIPPRGGHQPRPQVGHERASCRISSAHPRNSRGETVSPAVKKNRGSARTDRDNNSS